MNYFSPAEGQNWIADFDEVLTHLEPDEEILDTNFMHIPYVQNSGTVIDTTDTEKRIYLK